MLPISLIQKKYDTITLLCNMPKTMSKNREKIAIFFSPSAELALEELE